MKRSGFFSQLWYDTRMNIASSLLELITEVLPDPHKVEFCKAMQSFLEFEHLERSRAAR